MTELYKDDIITISLSQNPVTAGHLEVRPVASAASLQDLSDEHIEHLFFGASYGATALFELINAQGTNIIFDEKEMVVHVIARSQDDGLDFMWQPQQGDQGEMQAMAKSVKDKIDEVLWKKDNPQQETKKAEPKEIKAEEPTPDGEKPKVNWLLKSLNRSP